MDEFFLYDDRLGIPIPAFRSQWNQFSDELQQDILFNWEAIRGAIPDRIADLERTINKKQDELADELDFKRSCRLNSEIAELASIINDLWLWYRTHQDISEKIPANIQQYSLI